MGSPENKESHEKDEKKAPDSVFKLFRYADWVDVVLMVFGTIGAIGDGMSTNCLLLFASRLMNNLGYGQNQNNNQGHWMDEVEKVRSVSLSRRRALCFLVSCFHFHSTNSCLTFTIFFIVFCQQCSLYFVYLGLAVMLVAFLGIISNPAHFLIGLAFQRQIWGVYTYFDLMDAQQN